MSEGQILFQDVLAMLLDDDQDFPKRYLYQFSDVAPTQLREFLEIWPRVALPRKQSLLAKMEDQSGEDTLLSFDDLARALLSDPDAPVRAAAIRLLNECDDPRLVPVFLDILTGDSDTEPRAAAATALGLFVLQGELDEIPAQTLREIEDALLGVIGGSDRPEVRRRALESIGFSSRPEVPALLEAAYWRENPAWTASALFAMGRSSDDRWQEEVMRMLSSENQKIRLAAVRAAGELALSPARPVLLEMLEEEENEDIFSELIWSLSQIGGEDVRTYLENLLDISEDDEQMVFIEDAIANLDFTEDLQQFDLLAFDADDPPTD